MRVGIDAGRLGRGGSAILEALVEALLARKNVESVTVFGQVSLRHHPRLRVVPMFGTPSAGERFARAPIAGEPIAGEPIAGEPIAGEPIAGGPIAGGPIAGGPNAGAAIAGRLDTLRWAIQGWAEAAQDFDRVLSFSGFAAAPNQTVFVHNALYYDAVADTLPIGLRLRLQVLRELTHDAVLQANNVVVQSEVMRDHVRQAHGVDAHKIVTIPAVLQDGHGPAVDLLWVGNEVGFKDFHTAIEAAKILGRHLTLIGNTVPMPDGAFHSWLGDLDRAQVFAYYHNAKILVMTSRAESLGLPLVEAMQVGLPVVAPNLRYARELCADAAEYFEPGDAKALATTVLRAEARRDTLRTLERKRANRLVAALPVERFVDVILS